MEFDYVIAGGGSAGSVLAARLSEDPSVSVCLVEAGSEGRDPITRAPAAVGLTASINKRTNWAFKSEPQPALNNRPGYQPRGKALGGSSAINAMLYVRGHPSDYDHWAESGAKGWAYADVLPYFKKSEDHYAGADDIHGSGGEWRVERQRLSWEILDAFRAVAH